MLSTTERAGTDADLLAEKAEAEAAEAESAAAAARERASRLRQQAGAATEPARGRPGRFRVRLSRPRWTTVAAAVALLCTAALLTVGGYLTWDHRKTVHSERMRAEYTAAARQVAVSLMSIDHNNADGDVQRIIDNSTGEFRDEFTRASEDFVRLAKDAKVTTEATATAAAVESMTDDAAVVLVTVSSTVTNAEGAKDSPRNWRLSVDLRRDGDQIKMAKVEFVP
ncbi:hypothetical protein MI170_13785 [Mycolicibacterium goodii]|uniref:hypothetical protein n=1 Tax=Mycolicibacterium goodii TaxID=134601 RepID=UPI001F04FD22|nr:hypothetical protein [Mycolicibacterium goodii]ULN50303.1 hypothetical protein MI170_13785 [Mycolicibacterium goodii]